MKCEQAYVALTLADPLRTERLTWCPENEQVAKKLICKRYLRLIFRYSVTSAIGGTAQGIASITSATVLVYVYTLI